MNTKDMVIAGMIEEGVKLVEKMVQHTASNSPARSRRFCPGILRTRPMLRHGPCFPSSKRATCDGKCAAGYCCAFFI